MSCQIENSSNSAIILTLFFICVPKFSEFGVISIIMILSCITTYEINI